MGTIQEPPLHVVIVPTPGIGHLIPLIEFAKRLVDLHKFAVTFIIANDGSPMKIQKQLLLSLPEPISTVFLPPVSFDDLPEDAKVETRIILSLTRSLHFLRDAFKVLAESTRVVAFVVDVFGIDAFDIVREFELEPYVFLATGFLLLSLIFELPNLDQKYSCEYRDLPEPIKLPGCLPFDGRDIPDPLQHREDFAYKNTLQQCKNFPSAAGVIVNSFVDLEKGPVEALMEVGRGLPAVYPIGPLVKNVSNIEDESSMDCLRWLDEQPSESVVYVCFGSGGTLSQEQINELALGLEMSGQRFLWVVKDPVEAAANATFFGITSANDPLHFLPEGFFERTKEVGLVVPSWAPQIEVLSHGSTGGFVTHCGWNSILESIMHGVPLIAWPLYAEQKMNAVILKDGLKVALRVNVNEDDGLVGREDIAKYAKELIEGDHGKLLRSRTRELKDTANVTLSSDGSSTKSLAKVAEIWKKQAGNY